MREILFRGRRLDGIWRCGDLVRTHPCECHIVTANLDDYNDIEICFDDFVDYKTVGQFTGLKDKNGKKIFEGDIVMYVNKTKYVVKWDSECCGFYVEVIDEVYDDYDYLGNFFSHKIEVIGNIHDNPELLV